MDNPPHTHEAAEAFYVIEGNYTFYTDSAPVEGVGPGTFAFIPPGAVHEFRTGPEGARLLCVWPSTVEVSFSERSPLSPQTSSPHGTQQRGC